MKRIIISSFIIFILFVMLGIPGISEAQNQNSNENRHRKQKVANRPPRIKSFTTSFPTLILPCDFFIEDICSPTPDMTATLSVQAFDPDGDSLTYNYIVTNGEIIGNGRIVNWNLKGIQPGSYTAKVEVSDGHDGLSSSTLNIGIVPCPACDPPCTSITVEGPDAVDEGQEIVFTANISGGEPYLEPTYSWSVSTGKIISGQGTPTIKVDTTDLAAGQEVKATVKVGGLAPECQNEAASTTLIRKRSLSAFEKRMRKSYFP